MNETLKDVAIQCRITRSGFPRERVFRVTVDGAGEFVGAAPVEYFWNQDFSSLKADQPARRGDVVSGFIRGRIVDKNPEKGLVIVSVPSGDVLSVSGSEVVHN